MILNIPTYTIITSHTSHFAPPHLTLHKTNIQNPTNTSTLRQPSSSPTSILHPSSIVIIIIIIPQNSNATYSQSVLYIPLSTSTCTNISSLISTPLSSASPSSTFSNFDTQSETLHPKMGWRWGRIWSLDTHARASIPIWCVQYSSSAYIETD